MQVQFFPELYPEIKADSSSDAVKGESDLLTLLVPEDLFNSTGSISKILRCVLSIMCMYKWSQYVSHSEALSSDFNGHCGEESREVEDSELEFDVTAFALLKECAF